MTGTTTAPACPICGGPPGDPLFTSKNGYSILRCGSCRQVYTDTRDAPPPGELYPAFDQSATASKKAIRGALSVFQHRREAFIRSLKPTGRLLDYGCGSGSFAKWMSEAGFEVVGLEPFSLGTTVTSGRLTLMQVPLEEAGPALGSFDVITLWHVLEHLADPVAVLERLAGHLGPDGVLIVSVPNFRSWQRRAFNGGWFHLDPPRHLLHFESDTLGEVFRRAGLEPFAERKFLPEYGCSGWVQSVLNGVLPHKNYLYELAKDRGALARMSTPSVALHFAASLALGSPILAASIPVEAAASLVGASGALTVAARRRPAP